jgi:hypothetical protein
MKIREAFCILYLEENICIFNLIEERTHIFSVISIHSYRCFGNEFSKRDRSSRKDTKIK